MPAIGTVPYLNALPLVDDLRSDPDLQLVAELPARLVTLLREGSVDAALVSAVELFRDPPLHWYDLGAVSSRGPVQSILLFCRCAPARVTSLALDQSSRSAAVLAQVCLSRFLDSRVTRVSECSPDSPLREVDADAVLRIGDPALRTDPAGRRALDLGQLWTEHTGLPFVYALWLAHPDRHPPGLAARLSRALEVGLSRREQLARAFAAEQGMDEQRCVDYLEHAIGYAFGADELAGLKLFGAMAHELGLVDRAELPPPRSFPAA